MRFKRYFSFVRLSSKIIDAVCAFIQYLLERFNPDGPVCVEWSNDCSKPRTDAYGGGAALITSEEIRIITTREWLDQQIASLPQPNLSLTTR